MPTLDDITTLPKNLALAGNDNFAIADTSSGASSLIEQVPAAVISKYTHAFLLNFDSASVKVGEQNENIALKTFSGNNTHIISEAAVIVTKPFTNLNSPVLNLGSSANTDNLVDQVALDSVGAEVLNNNPSGEEEDEPLLFSNGQSLQVRFDAGSTKSLNDATAGQVVILVNIINVNDYIDLIPAFD